MCSWAREAFPLSTPTFAVYVRFIQPLIPLTRSLTQLRIPLYNVALFRGGLFLLEQPFYLEATGIVMAERKGGTLGRLPQYLSSCPPYYSSPAREMYVARMLKVYPIKHVCVEDAGKFHFLPHQ